MMEFLRGYVMHAYGNVRNFFAVTNFRWEMEFLIITAGSVLKT